MASQVSYGGSNIITLGTKTGFSKLIWYCCKNYAILQEIEEARHIAQIVIWECTMKGIFNECYWYKRIKGELRVFAGRYHSRGFSEIVHSKTKWIDVMATVQYDETKHAPIFIPKYLEDDWNLYSELMERIPIKLRRILEKKARGQAFSKIAKQYHVPAHKIRRLYWHGIKMLKETAEKVKVMEKIHTRERQLYPRICYPVLRSSRENGREKI